MSKDHSPEKLLVEHGFIASDYEVLYKKDSKTGKWVLKDPSKTAFSKKHAKQEYAEEVNLAGYGSSPEYIPTGFPPPEKRYRLIYESYNFSIEEMYYWFLNELQVGQAFPRVEKLTDVFSASENSAFFGQSAQRLSIQQDRASGFLKGIAELVKQLFQIIRELRIIDERLVPYDDWEKKNADGTITKSKSADSTLKGIFSDFAENKGGQMQPGSIYHLAQTVGYASLPDLFFNTHVYKKEDVDKVIDAMTQFNPNVRNVLKRKIYQFIIWKEKTYAELTSRRRFQIRYLRQHWATIKMYMAWTKPYLKHIKRLTMNQEQMDSPDLITAFESSMTEIELLCHKKPVKGYYPVVLATFQFRTRPLLQYRQDHLQGPVHVGRGTVTLRAYAWTEDQLNGFRKMREDEDKELLYLVDESVQAAMDELGEDLEKYLNETGKDVFDKEVHDKFGEKPKAELKKQMFTSPVGNPLEPFIAIFRGIWDITTALIPVGAIHLGAKGQKTAEPNKDAKKEVVGIADRSMWQAYKNYKKSHGLLSW